MHFPDDFSRQLYCQLLEDNNLSFSSFRTRALSRVFFRSFGWLWYFFTLRSCRSSVMDRMNFILK